MLSLDALRERMLPCLSLASDGFWQSLAFVVSKVLLSFFDSHLLVDSNENWGLANLFRLEYVSCIISMPVVHLIIRKGVKKKKVGFLFCRINGRIRMEGLQNWSAALGTAACLTGTADPPNLLFSLIHSLAHCIVLPDYWDLDHDFVSFPHFLFSSIWIFILV